MKKEVLSTMSKDDFVVIDTETGYFENGIIKPELDARKTLLIGIRRSSRKKTRWFTDNEKAFRYVEEIQEEKKKQGKNLYVYAHNFRYDLSGFGRNYLNRTDKVKIIRWSPLYGILNPQKEGEKGKKVGFLLDSLSFFPFPLEEVGKMVGIKKPELPKDATDINELKVRCNADIEIVIQALRSLKRCLVTKLEWNAKRMTTGPKLAMTYFNTECRKSLYCKRCNITWRQNNTTNSEELKCLKCNNKGHTFNGYLKRDNKMHPTKYGNFLRDAYYGSRNEAGLRGEQEEITLIDINSMYPKCMTVISFPDIQHEEMLEGGVLDVYSPEEIINEIARIGVIEATVFCPERKDKIGCLPVRLENRTHYPTKFVNDKDGLIRRLSEYEGTRDLIEEVRNGLNGGIVRGKWHSLTLRTALEEGYRILKIHNAVKYDPLPFNPLKSIMEKLHKLKKGERDEIMKHAIKLLMNSLYGKFGETTPETKREICHRKDVNKWLEKGYKHEGNFEEYYSMTKELGRKLSKNAHPMIALTITAMGQDLIYKEISKIPREDFVYMDTDSIIMKNFDKHKDKFKFGEDMGEWKIVKHEGEELVNVNGYITREKVYRLKNRIVGEEGSKTITKISGFRPKKGTKEDLTDEQIRGDEPIESSKMYSHKMGLSTGKLEKVGSFFTEIKTVNKENLKMDIVMPVYFESRGNKKKINEESSTL